MLFKSGTFSGALKAGLAGAALAGSLAFASGALAGEVDISNGQMPYNLIVHLSGPGYNGDVYGGPMVFTTAQYGQVLAWCVDVYHEIGFGPYSPALTYTDGNIFDSDSGGHSLTDDQIHQVGQLANFGQLVFDDASYGGNKSFTLAAVQGAIWQVVAGDDVTSGAAGFNDLVDNLSGANYHDFITGYGFVSDHITFITPKNYGSSDARQSFVFASAAPEPATWALMIGGFGLAGALLRRRRGTAFA